MGFRQLKKFATAGSLACLLATVGAASASAAEGSPEVPTGLSVTITDGLDEVTSDTVTTYTAELHNRGSETVSARLVVTVPGYAEITAAEGGEIVGVDVSWAVTVKPGETAAVVADAHIGMIPEGELRVTTLVSVYAGDDVNLSTPIIRSADANLIEGVTDPSTEPTASEEISVESGSSWMLPLLIGAGVLLAGAISIVVAVRARSRRGGTLE